MPRSIQDLPQHPARVLLPPLEVLLDMGFTPKSCLAGTGVSLPQMNNTNTRISLERTGPDR